jgi:hypothetical protein
MTTNPTPTACEILMNSRLSANQSAQSAITMQVQGALWEEEELATSDGMGWNGTGRRTFCAAVQELRAVAQEVAGISAISLNGRPSGW